MGRNSPLFDLAAKERRRKIEVEQLIDCKTMELNSKRATLRRLNILNCQHT